MKGSERRGESERRRERESIEGKVSRGEGRGERGEGRGERGEGRGERGEGRGERGEGRGERGEEEKRITFLTFCFLMQNKLVTVKANIGIEMLEGSDVVHFQWPQSVCCTL